MTTESAATRTAAKLRRDRIGDLYTQHVPAAVRLAYALLRDSHAAQDVAQEAFVRTASRLGVLRREEAFGAYLRQTVVNLARSQIRARNREVLVTDVPDSARGPDATDRVDARHLVVDALRRLPSRQQLAVLLRYVEGMPEQQVAQVMDCSPKAANALVQRAMTTLRRSVKPNE